MKCGAGERTDTDQWMRRESLEIGPHVYSQLIFNKGTKSNSTEKGQCFLPMGLAQSHHAEAKASAHHSFNPRLEPQRENALGTECRAERNLNNRNF